MTQPEVDGENIFELSKVEADLISGLGVGLDAGYYPARQECLTRGGGKNNEENFFSSYFFHRIT